MTTSINVDGASATPASEQILAQLRSHIRAGTLKGEARLPSVRQLAADLDVANGTVAKAYAALEAEGLVTTSRSWGTRVVPGRAVPDAVHRAALAFVTTVKPSGVSLESAISAVAAAWAEE